MTRFACLALIMVFTAENAVAAKTDPRLTPCERVMLSAKEQTAADARLFKRSLTAPVLEGGVRVEGSLLRRNSRLKPNELGNKWAVYFVGDTSEGCFDNPAEVMVGLKERLNKIAGRRAELWDVSWPLKIFMFCGHVQIFRPSGLGDFSEHGEVLTPRTSAYVGHHYNLRVKAGQNILDYNFAKQSKVIFLGAGDETTPSAWRDDFVIAHEIGHGTQYLGLFAPRFYKEGHADFKAAILSGQTKFSFPDGVLRDVSNPAYKNIDEFYSTFDKIADSYQVGSIMAYVWYQVWLKMRDMFVDDKLAAMETRVGDLVSNEAQHIKHEGEYVVVNEQKTFAKKHAQNALQFVASSMMQSAVEQQLPTVMIKFICDEWVKAGIRGPFRRTRMHTRPAGEEPSLAHHEEKWNNLRIPDTWNTCADLMRGIRPD